jgi:hypothetical protein
MQTEKFCHADINSVNKTDINCGTLHLGNVLEKNRPKISGKFFK